MNPYGRQFSAVYNEKWSFWSLQRWPLLRDWVGRRNPGARTWLDLCCGTGQILRQASDQGFAVRTLDGNRLSRPRPGSARLLYLCRLRDER